MLKTKNTKNRPRKDLSLRKRDVIRALRAHGAFCTSGLKEFESSRLGVRAYVRKYLTKDLLEEAFPMGRRIFGSDSSRARHVQSCMFAHYTLVSGYWYYHNECGFGSFNETTEQNKLIAALKRLVHGRESEYDH